MLPLTSNIRQAYANGVDQEQNFIQNLAMFLCTYLKEHGVLLEKKDHNEILVKVRAEARGIQTGIVSYRFFMTVPNRFFVTQALGYLVLISEVDEVEIFKICLEFWNALCADLYRENPYQPPTSPVMTFKVAPLAQLRRQFYAPILSKVKRCYALSLLDYFICTVLIVNDFFIQGETNYDQQNGKTGRSVSCRKRKR